MDAASLVLVVIGLLALLGGAAVTLGSESRDGFTGDATPRHVSMRIR